MAQEDSSELSRTMGAGHRNAMGLLASRSIVTAGLPYSESLATKALTSDFYHVADTD